MSRVASRRGAARSTGRVKIEESLGERQGSNVQGRVATRCGAQHRVSRAASRRGLARSTGRGKIEESLRERQGLDVRGRVATRCGAQHGEGQNRGKPK
jgi:hypothetical protein